MSTGGTPDGRAFACEARPASRSQVDQQDVATTVEVVFDPASAAQSEIARLFARHCPAGRIVTTPVRVDDALPASGFDVECVVLLDASRTQALREISRRTRHPMRLAVAFLDAWPADLQRFHQCYAAADLVLLADETLWRRLGPLPRACLLPLSLDDEVFRIRGSAESRGVRVIWLLPSADERQSAYEPWLPSPAAFLDGTGFASVVLPSGATAEQRADAFNRAAIVACASGSPAAQQSLVEAAACGCSIVITRRANRRGIVRDGITGAVVGCDGDSMLTALRGAAEQRSVIVANMLEWIRARSWRESARAVHASIIGQADGGKATVDTDLSGDVTVFVSTVGTASLPSCLAHLAQQDCRFRLRIIENVAPMSAAFQAMLDACDTPYYVQVDEDMLLHPDAVRRLHANLLAAPANVAFVVAYLHDVHLEAPVQGVKIFRHDIVRRYPFADVQSCELDQVDRLRADGFAYQLMPEDGDAASDGDAFPFRIVGLHGGIYSPRGVYERFRTLEMARRKHPRRFRHQEGWPAMLVERFLERRDPLDFYALMGLLAGTLSAADARGEKDFRVYSSLPGFDLAMVFMREAVGGDVPT
jgi:hypothetical protein